MSILGLTRAVNVARSSSSFVSLATGSLASNPLKAALDSGIFVSMSINWTRYISIDGSLEVSLVGSNNCLECVLKGRDRQDCARRKKQSSSVN
jgi:hypothetical protein